MLDFAYSRRKKMLAFAPAPTRGLSPSTNAGSVPFNTIYLRKINDRRCPKPGQGYVIQSASVPMPHPPTYAKHANRQANLIAISMIRRAEPFLLSLQP